METGKEKSNVQFTYGCELEWSDIDRRIDIPVELGAWEGPKIAGYYMGSEIDIVNTKGEWKGVGTDPLCITCRVGGEIHTAPSTTIDTQMYRIMRIMDLFPVVNVACPNHGHIHVGIPGIHKDLDLIKKIFAYTEKNEDDLIRTCCGYTPIEAYEIEESDLENWVKSYLLVGDGKHISPDLYRAIAKAESLKEAFEAIENIHCEDWYWTSDKHVPVYSHRTALNLFNLTKGETVEFRIFRASTNPVEIYSCLYFVKRYMEEAVKGVDGKSVLEILREGTFKFPKLNFDYKLAEGWQNTRQTKGRCGPFKKYTGACEIQEDPIFLKEVKERDAFDSGLVDILELCKIDLAGKTL